MPLPKLNAPPIRTPFVDENGMITPAWGSWLDLLWRKTGAESTVAPISVSGSAVAVPPTVTSSGAPTMPSDPGVYAVDEDTGDIYYNPTGEGGDWISL